MVTLLEAEKIPLLDNNAEPGGGADPYFIVGYESIYVSFVFLYFVIS